MNMVEFEDIKLIAESSLQWRKLKNKTLLISGGTGFLGQFLINVIKYRNSYYADGIKVISFSRHPKANEDHVIYLEQDVTKEIKYDLKADFVLHLASNTHPEQYSTDPIGTITTNVLGCINLLNIAQKTAARFLLASSVEVYGEGNGLPISEDYCGCLNCNTVRAGYNESKRLSESLCQSYRAQYGLECVIARLARCFGADKKQDSKAIAQFMRRAIAGEDIILKSKGQQRFSYCYVADAVSGIIKVLTDGKDGEAYNISEDDEGKTLLDYANEIAALANKEVIIEESGQMGASKANYAILNGSKIKALNWLPIFSISQGLERTYRILKEN